VLILEGNIEPGDYLSVRNFLRNETNFKKISGGVFLALRGGYVRESMKIGNPIRELRLDTDAESAAECTGLGEDRSAAAAGAPPRTIFGVRSSTLTRELIIKSLKVKRDRGDPPSRGS